MNDLVCIERPRDATKPMFTFRHALKAFLAWIAADAVAGLAIVAAAAAVFAKSGHKDPKEILALLPGDFTFVVTTTTVSAIIALTVIRKYAIRTPIAVFFPAVRSRTLLWAALSGLLLVTAQLTLESVLKSVLGIALPVAQTEQAINPKTWTQLGIAIAALAFIVPFVEEVLFRGYLFGWLKRVTPLWLAITLSAALFAAVHGLYLTRGGISGLVGTAEIFAIGILTAWWAARTNSLRPAYAVHLVINAMTFCLGFFLPAYYA